MAPAAKVSADRQSRTRMQLLHPPSALPKRRRENQHANPESPKLARSLLRGAAGLCDTGSHRVAAPKGRILRPGASGFLPKIMRQVAWQASRELGAGPQGCSHCRSQAQAQNSRGTDHSRQSTVVMATKVLTTLAFPQPLIDPVLRIYITMTPYLHLIYFNWLLHN